MTKLREYLEDTFEDVAFAESGELNTSDEKDEKLCSFEDIFVAIAMAEGGEEEYAHKLCPLFHLRHGRN